MLVLGKCILLLDGLDEVCTEKEDNVIAQVRNFSDKYNENKFIIGCRIAAYKYHFEKFREVQLTDFDDEQIKHFINNWFGSNSKRAEQCWSTIEAEPTIKELACLPLSLALLCLNFDEGVKLLTNRVELYEKGIDALLSKWDNARNVARQEVYKNLSLKRKEAMLSRIAATTFESEQYAIPQVTLEEHIADFIRNIPGTKEDDIEFDKEAILKSIETQHSIFVERTSKIYAFSHLTFQEYFTTKYIVDNVGEGTLENLVENHLTDDKWREIFLLTTAMLPKADKFLLLIKNKTDSLINENVAKFLSLVLNHTELEKVVIELIAEVAPVKKGVDACILRALKTYSALWHIYYFDRDRTRAYAIAHALVHALDRTRAYALDCTLVLDLALALALARDLACALDHVYDHNHALDHALALDLALARPRALESYLKANLLLVQCLNSDCYLSKDTRKKILNELLTVPQLRMSISHS
ncbi:MAG: signal transduction protein, partial [Acidobacteriota bacterium]